MSRYIDVDDIATQKKPLEWSNSYEQGKVDGRNNAIDYISNFAPTADVVEVVRCKDCKYGHQYTDDKVWCSLGSSSYRPNDYCSYGERREDARNGNP